MRSISPAARVAITTDAFTQLQRLQRELTRQAPRDKNYESNIRALQAAIRELRQLISRNVQ